jgi:2-C-methyl-D-erythritol 4-phosphate cytidylyltransferase
VVAQVPGGAARQDSEWAGLTAAAEFATPGAVVLLHDAARPFLTLDLLERLLAAAAEPDTIGVIPASGVAGSIVDADGRPIPTDDLVRVQTPQAFELALLLDCYPRAAAEGFSGVDTAQTVQRFGSGPIRWVEGDADNIKVTHPDDRPRAEALAARFADGRWTRSSPS